MSSFTQVNSAFHSASLGIERHLAMFEAAAHRIASRPVDTHSIRDIVDLERAKFGVVVNATVLRTSDEMTGQLVDLFA